MKNNTKIRLHLSKQLFESLTKQVLAEAKVNDGYSEAVKQPKQAKETKAQKAAPEVKSTDKMKKKMEEKMSSKEKMAKGLYKEDAGALQPGDNVTWKDGSQREYKGVVDAHEEGDYYKVKITAAPAGGHKEGSILTKQSGDLNKAVAEGNLDEISSEMDLLQQAAPILGTILGVGGTFLASYVKALKSAKTPKEKEELNKALRNQMNKSKGF
jgi:hypothetical protein